MPNIRKSFYGRERMNRIIERQLLDRPPNEGYITFKSHLSEAMANQFDSQCKRKASERRLLSTKSLLNSHSNANQTQTKTQIQTQNESQTQTQSQKLLTNGEIMSQMVDSNKDQKRMERVDQKMTKLEQMLNEMKVRKESKQMSAIVSECVRNELQNQFKKLSQHLKRAEEENRCLTEELLKIKCRLQTQDVTQDCNQQQNRCLQDFKQQIIDCLENNPSISSVIDSNTDLQKHLIQSFDDYFNQIKHFFRDIVKNVLLKRMEFEGLESIEWFDDI